VKTHQNALVPKAALLSSILAAGIFLAALATLFCSCGGSKSTVYESLLEAKEAAAQKDTWIVVEFWRPG
jgi:hypothetical protein